jgi:hypothetical protein
MKLLAACAMQECISAAMEECVRAGACTIASHTCCKYGCCKKMAKEWQ